MLIRTIVPACGVLICAVSLLKAQTSPTSIIARSGEPIAGAANTQFRRFLSTNSGVALQPPVVDENNACVFYASLQGIGSSPSTDLAIFRHAASPVLVARLMQEVAGSPGLRISSLNWVAVDPDDGALWIRTALSGTGVVSGTNDAALFAYSGSGLELAARRGSFAQGSAPGANYHDFTCSPSSLHASGGIFPTSVRLQSNGVLTSGLFRLNASTGVQPVLQVFGAAPDIAGVTVTTITMSDGLWRPSVLLGTLSGGDVATWSIGGYSVTNATAVWMERPDSTLALAARTGRAMNGVSGNPVLVDLHTDGRRPLMLGENRALISGTAIDPVVGGAPTSGVWRIEVPALGGDATFHQVLSAGAPVSGVPNLTVASLLPSTTVRSLHSNPDGSVTALVVLQGPGVTSSNNRALVNINNNSVTLLARGGSQAQGCDAGQTFTNSMFASTVQSSVAGHVTFVGTLQGQGVSASNNVGVWQSLGTDTRLCFRKGDRVGDFTIASIPTSGINLQVSDGGHVLAVCEARHVSTPTGTPRKAVVAWSPDRGPSILAVEGSPLALPTGGNGIVSAVRVADSQAINSRGRVVFSASLLSLTDDEVVLAYDLPSGPVCPPDYNRSGSVTIDDVFAFLTDWFAGSADYNNSGATNEADLFEFVVDWFYGCP